MEKSTDFVVLTTKNGRRFAIPCHIVAHDRACYYANLEGDRVYDEEYKQTMDEEFNDWARGNMNWEDVAEFAVELPRMEPKEDMDEQWASGKMSKPVSEDLIKNEAGQEVTKYAIKRAHDEEG